MMSPKQFDLFLAAMDNEIMANPLRKDEIIKRKVRESGCPYLNKRLKGCNSF